MYLIAIFFLILERIKRVFTTVPDDQIAAPLKNWFHNQKKRKRDEDDQNNDDETEPQEPPPKIARVLVEAIPQ